MATLADMLAGQSPAPSDTTGLSPVPVQPSGGALADMLLGSTSAGRQLSPEALQAREDRGNAWSNQFAIHLDNAQKSIHEGIGVVASALDEYVPDVSAYLKDYSQKGIERNLRQIASKPQPTRSPSFTESWEEVQGDFNEGDIAGALQTGWEYVHDASAAVIPSLGISIGAVLASAPVAVGTAATLGAVGVPAAAAGTVAGLTGLFTAISPSFLMGTGATYEEAKRLNASDEKAERLSLLAGLGIGILDRVGAGALVRNAMQSFGEKAVFKTILKEAEKQHVSKGTALVETNKVMKAAKKIPTKEFVKENIAFTALKAGARGAGVEAGTEALQEMLQIAGAGTAAGEGLNPYGYAEYQKRVIDNAALGALGGKMAGTGFGVLTGIQRKNTALKGNEINKLQAELENRKEFNPDELAKFIEQRKEEFKPTTIQKLIGRSITPLTGFATRSSRGLEVINRFEQHYNNVSAEIGDYGQRINEAMQKVRRAIKLPIAMRSLSKKTNDKLFDYMIEGREEFIKKYGDDPRNTDIMKAGDILRDDVVGSLIRPEIKLTTKKLKEALRNDLDLPPEIEALQDPELKANLTNLYNTIREAHRTVMGEPTITPEEAEQQFNNAFSRVSNTPEFKKLNNTVTQRAEGTGLYGALAAAGVDMDFVDGYLPRLYKVGLFKRGNKRRQFRKILAEQINSETGNRMGESWADEVIDNIRGNDGAHLPDQIDFNLDYNLEERGNYDDSKASFEKHRSIDEETFRKLAEAGLVEKNVKRLIDKYMLQALQRKNIKELKNFAEPLVQQLIDEKGEAAPTQPEIEQMKNIFSAFQHQYKPIESSRLRTLGRNFLTYQYILTLPLAALTAMTEPLIVFTRVDPKDAMFGAAQAARNTMRQGLRSVLPKLGKSKAEQAFNDILQGYDGTLAERLGDIAGIDVNRKITDKFFKAIMLTQITQFSRDMAFQASQQQMKRDIRKLSRSLFSEEVDKESIDAKRRLIQQGLLPKALRLDDPDSEFLAWAEDRGDETAPELIRKAQSKFVDEIIMAPNVVNRPLWMSNPHYAIFAQLKGFMMTFGNTVGMRAWREVIKPLARGRIPLDEAAKYAITLFLIMAGSIGIREIKDWIRYGDEDSSWKEMEGWDMISDAFIDSNIFGPGTIAYDAINAKRYGASPITVALGPGAQFVDRLIGAMGDATNNKPRSLARAIASGIPFLSAVRPTLKPRVTDTLEELLTREE